MRKMFLIGAAILCMAFTCRASDDLPSSAIKKGTLANAKLIQDVKVGVAQKVATMGCTQLGDVEPYVLAMPSGPVGLRHWKELWVVSGCGSKYPVNIDFSEDGPNAANWTVGK
jgi:hypothetical protein